MDAKLSALAATDLFAQLSKKHLELIGKVTDRVTVKDGTMLIHQGQVTTHMSIIIEGNATVAVDDKIVANVGPGDVVGELSMVDGERASATVKTDGEATIWHIGRAGFIPVWEKHPEISTPMLRSVVAKLRAADELLGARG